MKYQKFCKYCGHKHNCQQIYQQLGNTDGPTVTLASINAFLLPIAVFVTALVAFEDIFGSLLDGPELIIAVSFMLAFLLTFGFIYAVKTLRKQLNRRL